MKQMILLFSVLSIAIIIAIPIEERDFSVFLYGNDDTFAYDNWYSHLAENVARPGYNDYAPFDRQLTGFGGYVQPSATDSLNWYNAVYAFANDNLPNAQSWLDNSSLPFEVLYMDDTDTGRRYNVLRELPDTLYYDDNNTLDLLDDEIGAFTHGWGLIVKNEESTNPSIISVVHPCDDFIAVPVAYDIFKKLDARYLIINGVGREVAYWGSASSFNNSRALSDPSRNASHPNHTAFKAACDEIRETFNREEFVLQLHSYDPQTAIDWDVIACSGIGSLHYRPIYDWDETNQGIVNNLPFRIPILDGFEYEEDLSIVEYFAIANYANYPYDIYYSTTDSLRIQTINTYGGYGPNKQRLYMQSSPLYNYQNWLHIEMRESPSYCDDWRLYYNFDEETQIYNRDELFNKVIEHNSHWVDALVSFFPEFIEKSDGGIPPSPVAPLVYNPGIVDTGVFQWSEVEDANFLKYELLASPQNSFSESIKLITANTSINDSWVELQNTEYLPNYWYQVTATDFDGSFSQSNKVYIDSNYSSSGYPFLPSNSFEIEFERSDFSNELVEVLLQNKSNKAFNVISITGLEYPFSIATANLSRPLSVEAYDFITIDVEIDLHTPGAYESELILTTDCDDIPRLRCSFNAWIIDYSAPLQSEIYVDEENQIVLRWEDKPESEYLIYSSDFPNYGYNLYTRTDKNYHILAKRDRAFYRVYRNRKGQ